MTTIGQGPGFGTTTSSDKRIATLKASLALRGFAVHDTVTGGWLVARPDLAHYCRRIEDLEAFLRRAEAGS